jgi:hypothetical protein
MAEQLTWRDGYSDALLGRPRHAEYRYVEGKREPRDGFPEYQAGYAQGIRARARVEGDTVMPDRVRKRGTAVNWPIIVYIVGMTLVAVLRLKWFLWYLWIGVLVFLLALALDASKGPYAGFPKSIMLVILLVPAVTVFLTLQIAATVSFTVALLAALATLTVGLILHIIYGVFNYPLRWIAKKAEQV